MRRSTLAARAAAIAAVAALSSAFLSCGAGALGGARRAQLAADAELLPRLERILADNPLPAGWSLVEGGKGQAQVKLRLEARLEARAPAGTAEDAGSCGSYYRAAAVQLADARYSVTREEAVRLGLAGLESIAPPERALAVDGLWPGEEGYPFSYELRLSAEARGGKTPAAEIGRWLAKAAARERSAATRPLSLAAGGDIQVGEEQAASILGDGSRLEGLISPALLGRIRSADFAVANLESPISSRGEPNPKKRYQFRMPSGGSAILREAGFDLLLLANNHGFDYGQEAFLDTLDELRREGPPEVGAGMSDAEAASPRLFKTDKGEKLAFVGCAFFPKERYGFELADAAAGPGKPGIATDEGAALESVRRAAAEGYTVVVLAHGGTEYQRAPSAQATALYDRFAQAGAALVLGGHPHLVQGCAARSGALVAYSLGNFVFTFEDEPKEAWKSALFEFLVYRGKVRGLRLFPIVAGYYGSAADPDPISAEASFSRLCAALGQD